MKKNKAKNGKYKMEYRSSVTGNIVSQKFADENPSFTMGIKRERSVTVQKLLGVLNSKHTMSHKLSMIKKLCQ